ncbi:MAG: 16S rRNA (guanine(966)-N(2))-methyltransferase RsmD [Alphaproteobacteria bacterium]|nr:16S rRNA (guanine(966)-N(2))-methyltransferase RsmD [Alphaproteobacteria bacterium]
MRIVAGNRRGAKLAAPMGLDARPTADRVRESLFNILDGGRFGTPYKDKLVVDAFAGTGGLGLEALSRGASYAVFLEQAIPSRKALFQNIRTLRYEETTTVIDGDATALRRSANQTAGLILLDPPYNSALAAPCLEALKKYGWVGDDTLVVVEVGAKEECLLPEWLEELDARRYGTARLVFCRMP